MSATALHLMVLCCFLVGIKGLRGWGGEERDKSSLNGCGCLGVGGRWWRDVE